MYHGQVDTSPPYTHSAKHVSRTLSIKEVDTGAQFVAGLPVELDPIEAACVRFAITYTLISFLYLVHMCRKKIDNHVLPMMCILYWVQFMDKTTLGSSAILGIIKDTHLTTNQYNWLGTIFYVSYLIFQYPQNLALQRFPVGKWMSLNIFLWGVSLICHAACKNFAQLFVCRFFLGMCEGSTVAGFMIVTSMFYTRKEQTLRIGYWILMSGISVITTGFLSFGSLHVHTTRFAPWQWLMVITGIITLVVAMIFWFCFPDSPTNAWFLTPKERAIAIQRLKENQTGVENKHFKKEQMVEALLDPKTWLFALFAALDNVPNSLSNQRQIIISSFGFNYLQTTLLGCVDGLIVITTIWTGVNLAARIPNSRAYVGVIYTIPALIGVFMIEFLPWKNQIGLLFGIWLVDLNTTGYVLSLSWLTSTTAGHTKRVTTNAIMLSAYCIGNAAAPFMWQSQYKPRNHIPWAIIGSCYVSCASLLLTIRWLLARENARRDAEPVEDDERVEFFIVKEFEDGTSAEVKVDKEFMDLTDRQNRDFRYVL